MQVKIVFVPPGGGEQDYYVDMELEALPNAGDYISVRDEPAGKEFGTSDFIVRRRWWHLKRDQDGNHKVGEVVVEAEFAEGMYSSEMHKKSLEMYRFKGKAPQSHEPSGY